MVNADDADGLIIIIRRRQLDRNRRLIKGCCDIVDGDRVIGICAF